MNAQYADQRLQVSEVYVKTSWFQESLKFSSQMKNKNANLLRASILLVYWIYENEDLVAENKCLREQIKELGLVNKRQKANKTFVTEPIYFNTNLQIASSFPLSFSILSTKSLLFSWFRRIFFGNNKLKWTEFFFNLFVISITFTSEDCINYLWERILRSTFYWGCDGHQWKANPISGFMVDLRNRTLSLVGSSLTRMPLLIKALFGHNKLEWKAFLF